MGDVTYFYPPVYQQSPAGSSDNLTTGQNGAPGVGTAGKNGATIINGTAAPQNSQGNPGDYYYQLTGCVFWGPKTANGWPAAGVSLVGPAGAPGSKLYRVATIPTDVSQYADGDVFIDDQGNLAQVTNS